MPENRKSVVVDIISDSKRFLSGFEEAIKEIEKVAKKTNILGGMQDDIDELKQSILGISKIISNIKPTIDDSAIQKLQNKMESLDNSVKYLKQNVKDIKLDTKDNSSEKFRNELDKIKSETVELLGNLKQISSVGKTIRLGFDADPKNVKSIDDLKNKYNQALEAYNSFTDAQKKNGNKYTEEFKTASAELYKFAKLLLDVDFEVADANNRELGFLTSEDLKETEKILDSIESVTVKKQKEIEDILSKIDINQIITGKASKITPSADVAEFKLKEGKITIPLEIETTAAKLKKQIEDIIVNVQNSMNKVITVPFKISSATSSNSAFKKELKDLQSGIDLLPDGEIKNTAQSTLDNIKKQFNQVVELKIKHNISEVENDVNQGIKAIKKVIKDAGIKIYPEIELTDKNKKRLQEDILKISENFKIDFPVSDFEQSIKTLTDESLIKNWGSIFTSVIDEVCSRIEKATGQLQTSAMETLKVTSVKETGNISNVDIKELKEMLKVLHDISNTLSSLNSNNITLNLDSEALKRTNYILIETYKLINKIFDVSGLNSLTKQFDNLRKKFQSIVKTDGSFDARKKELKELISEYQKYLDMGGKQPISDLTENEKSQKKLLELFNKHSAQSIEEEKQAFSTLSLSAEEAAKAKEKFVEANKKVKDSADNSVSSIKDEKNVLDGIDQTNISSRNYSDITAPIQESIRLQDNLGREIDDNNAKLLRGTQLIDEQNKGILTLYHNSNIEFDKFESGYSRKNQSAARLGEGQYFAFDKNSSFSDLGDIQTEWYANVSKILDIYNIPKEILNEIIKSIDNNSSMSNQYKSVFSEMILDDVETGLKSAIDLIRDYGINVSDIFQKYGYDAVADYKLGEINVFDPNKIFKANQTPIDAGSKSSKKKKDVIDSSEAKQISDLSKKLQEIIKKIKEKNELFEKEGKIVAQTIPNETDKIGKLVSALNHVKHILEEIGSIAKESGLSKLTDISELNKLKPEKISSISTALSSLANNINNLSINDTSFLSSINDILSKADELKSLANILKESKAKISEVEKVIKDKDKTEEKQLSEKYFILKDDLKEILRLTKEYEKADVYTKEDIKKQIAQYQDRADTIQLEIWELDKINDAEQNRVDILREQISLEESRQQNKEFSTLERQEASAESLINSLREQNEYLEKDSNEWSHALELLSLYKNELKDVVNITRNVRLDEKTGFRAISYKFADSEGSSKTVGANSDLLIDSTKIASLTELYTKLKKSVNEYYSSQSKILKGDKSDKTQTESLQAYNTMLQVQREIAYWKEKGLQPSEEQLLIEQRLLSITSTLKEQQKQSGLDNMYQTVLNTITRLNKKTKEVNELRIKSDGTDEFVKSIQNAQDNVSTLIGTLRGFKFNDFFSQDALQSFGLDGDALLFDNGDLNSLKWVINQLPLTESQLQKIHDVLDDNVKITEKNVALQNQVAEKQKLDAEVSRKKEAAENLEMINNSLSRQYELTNKIYILEQNGRTEEAKIVNDELVKEIRNCEALVAGYKTFDDVIDDVGANLQQVFNLHQFDFDKFNAKLIDEKEIRDNQEITKHNQDIIIAYKERNKQTKEYYELLEKVKSGTATDTELARLNQIIEQWDKAINKKDEYNIQHGGDSKVETDAKKIQDEFVNSQSLNYSSMVDKYVQGAQVILSKLSQYNFTDNFQTKINEASEIINKLELPLDLINDQESIKDIGILKNLMSEINGGWKIDSNRISNETAFYKLQGKIADTLRENTAMSPKLKKDFRELQQEMERWGASIPTNELKKLSASFFELDTEMKRAGKTGRSFFDMVTNKAKHMSSAFIGQYLSLYDFVRYAQQAYQYVAEIDKQMIELEKVSDMSTSRLEESFEHATIAAKDLGSTVSDVISATADWSRLGYDADTAEQLAEVATVYKNVGDGIDISTANESLISTLQGFQMEASQAMEIVDSFNEVANRMPIDSAGIGEALQRSASAFNAANTDLNSAISLITATNSVLQNPEKVGRMWTTVSARIRGAKQELVDAGEETDGMVESSSKLRDLVKGTTGFDIMADENTFKDMKEIIVGIGKEWDKLSDIDQAGLLEALAGKQQSNALAAALSNYEMIEEAYEIAENSAGSAMKEQEKWEQGLEARTNKLKASLETLSTTFLDSDFLGGLIDTGRGLIDILTIIIDKLGVIPTLLTAIGGGIGISKAFKGEGKRGKTSLFLEYALGNIAPCGYIRFLCYPM